MLAEDTPGMQIRAVDELDVVDGAAWPGLVEQILAASTPVRVLEVSPEQGREVLVRLQVSTRSVLGSLARYCGGLVLDHGWLRILGGGSPVLPDLATVNGLTGPGSVAGLPGWLVVAYDVLGGRFAIDGGGLGIGAGQVGYWGPDSLTWVGLDGGHSAFLSWALSGGLDSFYASLRWPGWQEQVTHVGLGEGLSVYPPPFTALPAGHRPAGWSPPSRRAVPFPELLAFYDDAAAQVADLPEGAAISFGVEGYPAPPAGVPVEHRHVHHEGGEERP
jgi:hypothetical protein